MQLIEVSSEQNREVSWLARVDLASLVEWSRLVLISFVFLVLSVGKMIEPHFYNPDLWLPLMGLFILSSSAHLLFALAMPRVSFRRSLLIFSGFLDAALIAGLVALYGQAHAVFLLLFLVNIALVGCYVGISRALSLGLVSAGLFNFVLTLSPDFLNVAWSPLVTLYNGSCLLSATLAGLFHIELTRVTETIETQREDIKSLQDINQLIVENVGSGLIVTDVKNEISKSNRAAAKILGDLGLTGKNIFDVLPGLRKGLSEMEHREGAVHRFEFGHLNYEGAKMILEVIASPLIRRPYGFQGTILLLQNLTELKNYEENLKQQEKMAAIGSMAAGIAHEIRNPLASISGSIQLIAASLKPESDEDRKLTNIIVKEIDRLNRLIAEFLEFVKPPMKVDDPVDVNILISEIVQITKSHPQVPKDLKIEMQLNSKEKLSGHYDKLKQAFLNIVLNATQAVEKVDQPSIRVVTFSEHESVFVKVIDNGMGMSRETLSRIFVPFFTTKSKGTGLGLAITHKIFEAHEAIVKVESELQGGTSFIIEFKRRRES